MKKAAHASSNPRENWVDYLRGISIFLVLLLHSHGSSTPIKNENYGWAMDLINTVNLLSAPFRMELMFFLSGLFVSRGMEKGVTKYFSGKVINILYPFILWSILIFALKEAKSVFLQSNPIDWTYLISIIIGSTDLTWFLYDLFIFYLFIPIALNLKPLPVILACVVASAFIPHEWHEGLPGVKYNFINNVFYYFLYFYFGALATTRGYIHRNSPSGLWLSLSLLSVLGVFFIAWNFEVESTWPVYAPLVAFSFIGIVEVAKKLAKSERARFLKYLGKHSMTFYLVHFPVQGAASYFLCKYMGGGGLAVLITLLGLGLFTPWLVIRLQEHAPWLRYAFSFRPKLSFVAPKTTSTQI